MNKAQLKKFKTMLEEKRDEIVKKAKQTLSEDMMLDANDLPDEMDLASSDYLQSFTFRLSGREKSVLDKIEKELSARPDRCPTLKGDFEGLRKTRMGDYRVVYAVLGDDVLILRIGHRREVYR